MSQTLRFTPVRWTSTSLETSNASNTPEVFVLVLDIFDVEHTYQCAQFGFDFEVERESLKKCRMLLLSGEYSDEQDEAYRACLDEMNIEHDQIVKAITEILSAKSEWIHVAWF